MADMVEVDQMEKALQHLNRVISNWCPIVYVNSNAEVKACCGRNGGSTCTSSNAERILKWAFDKGDRVLFLPDEHLGANSAHDLGVSDDEMAVYDYRKEHGGLSDKEIKAAKIIVWKGFCIVHQAFTIAHVEKVREMLPDAKIIVHPESPKEIVRICDAHGSTAQIIEYVRNAPDGSTVIVGTELNLVQRLAEQERGRVTVKALTPSVCANMAKTNEANLLDTLKNWPEHQQINVDSDIAVDARTSLETMLAL
jgi:quinolinate synthase